jgi:hypothetical protein
MDNRGVQMNRHYKHSRLDYLLYGETHCSVASYRFGAYEVVLKKSGKVFARKIFGTETLQAAVLKMMESFYGYEEIHLEGEV